MGLSTVLAFIGSVATACIGVIYFEMHEHSLFSPVSIHHVSDSFFVEQQTLLAFRLFSLVVHIGTILALFSGPSYTFKYGQAELEMIGIRRFGTFTVWTFCLETLYFAVATLASVQVQLGTTMASPSFLHLIWGLFDICLPVAILIFTIVTFVLYPAARKAGMLHVLNSVPALIMHNFNVFSMLTELVLNKLPVKMAHLPFVLCYGVAYLLFALLFFHKTGIFFYFFLDYRNSYAMRAYLALFLVISLFYCIGYFASTCLAKHV